jgi:glycosyltransferase involved in cell wall biosynthesis
MASGDDHRLLIISPVRNEATHIELVAAGMARQTRPPALWLVVDDGSTDDTLALLHRLEAEIPFMRVLSTPPGHTNDAGDRHAVAAAPRAFNWALGTIDAAPYTHIGKLDGDIELPNDYFERLLPLFDVDPELGVAGGVLVERVGEQWEMMRTAPGHVRGALKLYRHSCFDAIGGLREHLGWDGVDETYARLRGYRTWSFVHIVARHHRVLGSADGILRARARGGQTHYVIGFSFPWILLKSLKQATLPPIGISGLAFVYGYLRAWYRSVPRIEDAEYRHFARQDERRRLMRATVGLARRKLHPSSAAQ